MPVDFTKLPPEEPEPDNPPSRFIWTIVFFVIVLAGVFAVLLLWPKGEPTQTLWFWICVTVYPLGVAAFVVLRRYSVYEGRRLDAVAWNEAREKHVNGVFEQASRALAVMAASYRFSSDAKEDAFGKLLDGSVKLEPRIAPKPDTPPVNARWFEKPDTDEEGKRFESDAQRRHHVLAWAFGAVLDEVAEAVRSLPPDLKLVVQLALPGLRSTDEVLASWNAQWQKFELRPLQASVLPAAPDLMYLDAWLDRVNQKLDHEARLLLSVRLNSVLQALPPDGSAEAVVAMLIAPESVRQELKLAPIALLHRPNGTQDCAAEVALTRALQWGRVEPAEVKRLWQSGLDATTANSATAAMVKAGIGVKSTNIDYMVGHAGEVAPWLDLACAAKAAVQDGAVQLVVTGREKGTCFSVVRNIHAR